jgi:hypothetical protein
MVQQLYLAFEPSPVTQLDSADPLLEETRQLFQHDGSNAELMSQIMSAIRVLHDLCNQPGPKQVSL